ncbi:YraN family protein [Acinetobacter sp. MD2(2019)]|uniref:YraN family protein n=1 Tax=Acinetobacter sp. MD2(2019) TaxID=2605273 RepID=UPI002D1ECC3B|nr:YraN family protein [Acinetobacter sp. MD2(2019)]MEB3753733.1 YraN family protein [Acinetobacter sp. MD2(2019)]
MLQQDKKHSRSERLGRWAEQRAAAYLQQHGFDLLHKNFHSRFGEIDLIMRREHELIFVEVKARSNAQFGQALEMITPAKQQKMIKTALCFLDVYPDYQQYNCRFDAVCIQFKQQIAKSIQQDFSQLAYDLDWIESAFTLD